MACEQRGFESKEKAIAAWNTRAERTCGVVRIPTGERAQYDCQEVIWHCKSCHSERAVYAFGEDGDVWAEQPAYCPVCGANLGGDAS